MSANFKFIGGRNSLVTVSLLFCGSDKAKVMPEIWCLEKRHNASQSSGNAGSWKKLLCPTEFIPVFFTLIIQQGALGLRSELLSLAQTFMPVFLSSGLGNALKVDAIALTSNNEKPSMGGENTFGFMTCCSWVYDMLQDFGINKRKCRVKKVIWPFRPVWYLLASWSQEYNAQISFMDIHLCKGPVRIQAYSWTVTNSCADASQGGFTVTGSFSGCLFPGSIPAYSGFSFI